MEHKMITSASGWRKVFCESGNEEDNSAEIGNENRIIAALVADSFADYILSKKKSPIICLGFDTRPTGSALANPMLKVFLAKKVQVVFAGVIAAPEIMAYARTLDAFVYISASHNPIGHNGIKFGLNDGGVLSAEENAKIVKEFEKKCAQSDIHSYAETLISSCPLADFDWVLAESASTKNAALNSYRNFSKHVIAGSSELFKQNTLFARLRQSLLKTPISVVADMNGSARTLSIDSSFLNECGIKLHTISNSPGEIKHAIIPEPENLVWAAEEIEKRQKQGEKSCLLGYMPDCDGDRGNIVYWDEVENKAVVLKAQEVFALCVLAEIAFLFYQEQFEEKQGLAKKAEQYLTDSSNIIDLNSSSSQKSKIAVAVNGPTSMRIEEIAGAFGAEVFRAEVGEANVVNLAREKRDKGFIVRILGEGSNGGNITHPSAVRDPLSTIFALVKLLVLKDEVINGNQIKGLFHLWCEKSGQMKKYKENFSLHDVIDTLPKYTTTGVSEKRAILHINTKDHSLLKRRFQTIFESQWKEKCNQLQNDYGFYDYQVVITNGTIQTKGVKDYSLSKNGGLKIIFKDKEGLPLAFIWMRGSGTEPVFRVMCDVKGEKPEQEKWILDWETRMLNMADLKD
ncbi:phosphoglucomutase [Treponema pectinovorum]|uniref:phosphoglucomutase n=1 Tax=Treponema pectinovorum TaxID=164 RepID=UPI0021C2F2A0|nr:phosphoglucomutase [Treponema pectinovorum]